MRNEYWVDDKFMVIWFSERAAAEFVCYASEIALISG